MQEYWTQPNTYDPSHSTPALAPNYSICGSYTLDIIANNPIAQKVVELSSSQPYSLVEHSL